MTIRSIAAREKPIARSRDVLNDFEKNGMSGEPDALVDIWVTDRGPRAIRVYQMVDRLTGLNIKQARKLVDSAPQAVVTQVPQTQAEALKIEMEATGATVELRPAGMPGEATDLV